MASLALRLAFTFLVAVSALDCSSTSDDSGPAPSAGSTGSRAGAAGAAGTSVNAGTGSTVGVAGAAAGSPGAAGAGGQEPTIDWVESPAGLVDTLVGTTNIEQGFRGANVFPGADAPFGMVQWSPDTSPRRPSGGGYDYKDSQLIGFSLTHLSGPGCNGALGDVPILPLVGPEPGGDWNALTQPFTHEGEVATAGYYALNSGSPAIRTELTATRHSAMARFTYPRTNAARLLVKLRHSANGNDPFGDSAAQIVSDREVSGSTTSGGFCGTGVPYVLYFDLVFDRPFTASKIVNAAGKTVPGYVWLTFDASETAAVQAKVGISYVSVANARGNWTAENPANEWSFDAVKQRAVDEWNDVLGQVRIAGGTREEQALFYTSLYHSLLHPNIASDVNGQYMGFDKKVHSVSGAQREQYVNFSGWDTYRTQSQLAAIVAPKAMSDAAQSMLNDAAQSGGRLPRWSLQYGENSIMPGDPADGILAGYYAFGARDFDASGALKAMVKQASEPNGVREHLAEYLSYGYVPDDVGHSQAAGLSLELYQADFAIAQLARALGDEATAKQMLQRSQSWQLLFDASVNMFIPKRKDGSFVPGVGLSSSHGLTEGDASQYRWSIPLNRKAQWTAMGGKAASAPALDAFFEDLDDYEGPRALFTNEFQLGAQNWGNHSGEAWRTQEVSGRIRTEIFHLAPGFMNDNEDLGAMSSSLVWNMLGLHPNYPGSAILAVNSPAFPHARVQLPSGKALTIHADGARKGAPYIQALKVDGQVSDRTWLDASVVDSGATLTVTMSATRNDAWGENSADPLESAGMDHVSGFLYATPNPLVLAPKASAELTLYAKSARPDAGQKLSWTASATSFSFATASGSFDLGAGGTASSKLRVTAPNSAGSYLIRFELSSSLGPKPPTYVLPVTVK